MAKEITQLIHEGWHLQFFLNDLQTITGLATKDGVEIAWDCPSASFMLTASKLADKIDEYEDGNIGLAESEVIE